MGNALKKWNQLSLVKRILIGLLLGVVMAVVIPAQAKPVVILGSLFVGALKAVAPMLVFFLVMSAISQHKSGHKTTMKSIVFLYLMGTFLAGLVAVLASFMFPVTLQLVEGATGVTPPEGVVEVLKTLLMNIRN